MQYCHSSQWDYLYGHKKEVAQLKTKIYLKPQLNTVCFYIQKKKKQSPIKPPPPPPVCWKKQTWLCSSKEYLWTWTPRKILWNQKEEMPWSSSDSGLITEVVGPSTDEAKHNRPHPSHICRNASCLDMHCCSCSELLPLHLVLNSWSKTCQRVASIGNF